MTEVKKEGVLSLVLPENTKVSGKSINIEETVSHRSLEKGTMDSYVGTDWYQKVLFYQYLVNYLGNYVEKKQDRVLEYELEYVLGGKRNDADNLKIVVSELLAMREPLNMASLTASSQRQSEAMALAVIRKSGRNRSCKIRNLSSVGICRKCVRCKDTIVRWENYNDKK